MAGPEAMIAALKEELRAKSAECDRLAAAARELEFYKQLSTTQRVKLEEQEDQLAFLRVAHQSALDMVESLKRGSGGGGSQAPVAFSATEVSSRRPSKRLSGGSGSLSGSFSPPMLPDIQPSARLSVLPPREAVNGATGKAPVAPEGSSGPPQGQPVSEAPLVVGQALQPARGLPGEDELATPTVVAPSRNRMRDLFQRKPPPTQPPPSNQPLHADAGPRPGTLPEKKMGNGAIAAALGTIVKTSGGDQIIYNSSSISSVGFGKQKIPFDFLGGNMDQLRYAKQQQGIHQQHDSLARAGGRGSELAPVAAPPAGGDPEAPAPPGAEEDAEVNRLVEMVGQEALLDIRHAEVADHEEKELEERFRKLQQFRR